MKLISCYVENFGALHAYSVSFSDRLTVLQAENGFGKTTLAEFLRAMFYGFPAARGKSAESALRRRFAPWQGGRYGGSLVFETEGVRYRIERSFGSVPKEDTFALYEDETGLPGRRFGADLGTELFRLDSDSFARSTYLPQQGLGGDFSTQGILAKLSNLVEDTNDINNYDKARELLARKRSSFCAYRGSGGSVNEAQSRVSALQSELSAAEAQRETLASLQSEIAALEAQRRADAEALEAVRAGITRASQSAARRAVWEQDAAFSLRREKLEARLSALRQQFPSGCPDDAAFDALDRLADAAALAAVPDAQGEALRDFFRSGAPDDAFFRSCAEAQEALTRLQSRRDLLLLQQEQSSRSADAARFASGVPSEEELSAQRSALSRSEELRRTRPRRGVVPLLAALLLAGCGCALLLRHHYLPGGLAMALAAVLTAFSPLARRSRSPGDADALERGVDAFVSRWLPETAGTPRERLYALETAVRAYADCRARADETAEALRRTDAELAAQEAALWERLAPYFPARLPFGEALAALRAKREQYAAFLLREESAARAAREYETALAAFAAQWQLPAPPGSRESLRALREDSHACLSLRQEAEALQSEYAAFRANNASALSEAPQDDADVSALKARERALTDAQNASADALSALRQKQQQTRGDLDRIPALQDELARTRAQQEADLASCSLLDETMNLLAQAKEELSTAYLGSIRRSFAAYASLLTDGDGAAFRVSSDLSVSVEKHGETHALKSFSAGQQDAAALCMRFALVDALFTAEKPFLILDDPFVNLDDAHTAAALRLLRDLSETHQIVYLVCHSSRTPEQIFGKDLTT